MCIDLNVNLPTLVSFLLLYSLKTGCIVILIWTLLRSLSLLIFFILAMVDTFLPVSLPITAMLMTKRPPDDDHYFPVFTGHLIMIITESFLFIFSIVLGSGLYSRNPFRIGQYVVCRFFCWISETTFLSMLCIVHLHLIGWYLVFLMVIILEFYNFIVVYSYYMDLMEEFQERDLDEREKEKAKFIAAVTARPDCEPGLNEVRVGRDSKAPNAKEMLCTTL
ncbi:unnamed protein product [Spodoptera littoralis]|uniref:Uncharacterized protein n=1 Tax=Spodoptera littoralis TaxID=7109 RepID=A0A9P0N0J9_SPOLI|nr:unnamed protein product [Spodoptera littoralis]CAH1637052.1 unnamed protein product [Spodoptera littoralis]